MAAEEEVLPGDIDQVLGNYKERHENGESFLEMAKQVEAVDDKRLAAVLRKLHRGHDPQARTAPPVDRKPPGNKAVAASDDGKGK